MSKFCSKCGALLNAESSSCPRCGAVAASGHPKTNAAALILKLGVLISGVALGVSSFLPYISVSVLGFSQSWSLNSLDDRFYFVLLAAILAAVLATAVNKPLLSLIFGVLTALLSSFEMIYVSTRLRNYEAFAGKGLDRYLNLLSSILVSKGVGYYMKLISSAALAVFCILFFIIARKKKS